MNIDHDPKEPSHRALVIMAVLTFIITIGVGLVLREGLTQVVDALPDDALTPVLCLIVGIWIGLWLGKWDSKRHHSRSQSNDE